MRPHLFLTLSSLRLAWVFPVLALAACTSAPPVRMAVYDFGPGMAAAPIAAKSATPAIPATSAQTRAVILLADVEAPAAQDGAALHYRLAYAQPLQMHPYAAARWSVPAAQLVRQRLRDTLGQQRTVLAPGDVAPPGAGILRVELEEFSQVFDSAQTSAGLLRARATFNRPAANPASAADRLLAQTVFVIRQPAITPDAAGGARALAAATDQLAQQLDQWLQATLGEASAP